MQRAAAAGTTTGDDDYAAMRHLAEDKVSVTNRYPQIRRTLIVAAEIGCCGAWIGDDELQPSKTINCLEWN